MNIKKLYQKLSIKIKKDGVVNSFECRNDYTKEDIRKELNTWNIL